MRLILLVAFAVLLSSIVYAQETLPEELIFTAKAGETIQETVTFRVRSEQEIPIRISAVGPIKSWIQFNQTSFRASAAAPSEFQITINPPSNTPLGVHEGTILVEALSKGNALTTVINNPFFLKVKINITETDYVDDGTQKYDITLPLDATAILFWAFVLLIIIHYIRKKTKKSENKKKK